MTTTTCCYPVSADELVTSALSSLDDAGEDVCLADLPPEVRHHIIGHLTSVRGFLLTPPVRPAGAGS